LNLSCAVTASLFAVTALKEKEKKEIEVLCCLQAVSKNGKTRITCSLPLWAMNVGLVLLSGVLVCLLAAPQVQFSGLISDIAIFMLKRDVKLQQTQFSCPLV